MIRKFADSSTESNLVSLAGQAYRLVFTCIYQLYDLVILAQLLKTELDFVQYANDKIGAEILLVESASIKQW